MSAFSRFRALRHLNLNLLRAHKISGSNAETSGRHLLDRGAAVRVKTFNILAAFTGIGLSMQTVHSDCQRLMRFLGDRSVRHCAGLEPCHNRVHALHFLKRNPLLRIVEVKLSSQVDLLAFLIHHLRVLFEHIIVAASRGLLKHMDGLRIIEMLLPSAFIFVSSHTVKGHIPVESQRVKRLCVECSIVFCNLLNSDTADTAHRICEVPVNKLFLKSDRLEDLGSLIRLNRGDTHLGRNLDDPVDDRAVIIVNSRIIVFMKQS